MLSRPILCWRSAPIKLKIGVDDIKWFKIPWVPPSAFRPLTTVGLTPVNRTGTVKTSIVTSKAKRPKIAWLAKSTVDPCEALWGSVNENKGTVRATEVLNNRRWMKDWVLARLNCRNEPKFSPSSSFVSDDFLDSSASDFNLLDKDDTKEELNMEVKPSVKEVEWTRTVSFWMTNDMQTIVIHDNFANKY